MTIFSLLAKLVLNKKDFEDDLNSARSKFGSFADGVKKTAGAVGNVLSTMAKGATIALGAAGTAVSGLVKQSLSQYANFEQLAGGVEKIFGDSAKKVQDYANEAYKTAGMSANEYMETVTSFSASLLQGLSGNTELAADIADRAIRDMSDNANTYGTDMASIQNAYAGFSKQNFTMLDNLKLGYGGTKEEMERLIRDAAGMNKEMQELGVTVDADSMSFDNIINAISVMQKHLKITDTTKNEALGTISGSLSMLKAAWSNFLTGTGSPEQVSDALVSSIGNISKNLKTIVPRLVEGLKGLASALAPEIPKLLIDILPTIIEGAAELLQSGAAMLPEMIQTIIPPLIQGVVMVMSALVENLPEILQSLADALPVVFTTLMQNSGGMLKAGKEILGMLKDGLVAGITYISEHASEIVGGILDALIFCENLAAKATEFAGGLISKLINGLLSEETLGTIVQKAPEIVKAIVNRLVTGVSEVVELGSQIIEKLVDYLFGDDADDHWTDLIHAAAKIIGFIWDGIASLGKNLGGYFDKFAEKIADAMGLGDFYRQGKEIISNIWNGVKDEWEKLKSKFEAVGEWLYDALHKNTIGNTARQRINEQLIEAGIDPEELEEQARQAEIDKIRKDKQFGVYSTQESRIQYGTNTYYSLGKKNDFEANPAEYARNTGAKGVPVFGNGGIVTKPTLALIGEDGAEAVVPLEKDSDVGRRFGGSFTIEKIEVNVDAHGIDDLNQVGNLIVQQIDTALRRYQVQQIRGQGGTAWQ